MILWDLIKENFTPEDVDIIAKIPDAEYDDLELDFEELLGKIANKINKAKKND